MYSFVKLFIPNFIQFSRCCYLNSHYNIRPNNKSITLSFGNMVVGVIGIRYLGRNYNMRQDFR